MQVAAATPAGKANWVAAISAGLEVALQNAGRGGAASAAGQMPVPLPPFTDASSCAESGEPFSLTQPRYNCLSCGGGFVAELVTRDVALPQHGIEGALRCCDGCRTAQELATLLEINSGVLSMYAREVDAAETAAMRCLGGRARRLLGPLGQPPLACLRGEASAPQPLADSHGVALCRRWFRSAFRDAKPLLDARAVTAAEVLELVAVRQLAFRDEVRALAKKKNLAALIQLLYAHRVLSTPKSPSSATSSSSAPVGSAALGGLLSSTSTDGSLACFSDILDALFDASGLDIVATLPVEPPGGDHENGDQPHEILSAVAAMDGIDFVLPQILHIYFLLLPTALSLQPDDAASANHDDLIRVELSTPAGAAASATGSATKTIAPSVADTAGSTDGRSLGSAVDGTIRLELLRNFLLRLCSRSLACAA